jgi:hypothetical protein
LVILAAGLPMQPYYRKKAAVVNLSMHRFVRAFMQFVYLSNSHPLDFVYFHHTAAAPQMPTASFLFSGFFFVRLAQKWLLIFSMLHICLIFCGYFP